MEIKKDIPSIIMSNKELLRSYLCGYFDGDGGITGEVVSLCFGKNRDYKYNWAESFQKSLYIFGVQSRVRTYSDRTNVQIRKRDCTKFMNEIGFIGLNKIKKLSSLCENFKEHFSLKVYGRVERVKEIIFTEEEIQMYDIVNSETNRFMADGFIVHNSTASDVVNKCIINAKNRIEEHDLDISITLPVHDEATFVVPDASEGELKMLIKVIEMWMIEGAEDVRKIVPLTLDHKIGDYWSK